MVETGDLTPAGENEDKPIRLSREGEPKTFGERGSRAKTAARGLIIAVVLAFAVMGWTVWQTLDGVSTMHNQLVANHKDRLAQDAEFKKQLIKLQAENKDLACSTRAFFLLHAPKPVHEPPFLLFLNKRYHCGHFELHQ